MKRPDVERIDWSTIIIFILFLGIYAYFMVSGIGDLNTCSIDSIDYKSECENE